MKKEGKKRNSKWVRIIIVCALIIGGFSMRMYLEQVYDEMQVKKEEAKKEASEDDDYNEGGAGRELAGAEEVADDDPILLKFKEQMPDYEVLVAGREDITDDGCDDLVVIYREEELAKMVVLIDSGDGENYTFTESVLAPRDNQRLRFFNMDKEGEMEFVVQGEKHGKTGYGIFRIIDGAPVNLFAEGMDEC